MKMKKILSLCISAALAISAFTAVPASAAVSSEDISTYLSSQTVYNLLPECDQTAISAILNAGSYEDNAELAASYQTALEKTTIADTENYNIVLNEDFSNLDESWKQTNVDSGLIGNGKFKTNRESLDVKGTGENYSAHFCGTSLVNHINYIERAIDDPNSVITFYAKISNNTNVSIQAAFDDTQGVGTHAEANARRIKNINGSGTSERVDTSKYIGLSTTNWNKIVIDGTTDGKVSCYVNGALLSTVEGTISNLKIGSIFNYAGYSVVAVDNITIATPKTADDLLVNFNAGTVTESSLSNMLGATDKDSGVFSVLPDCDREAIVAELENGRPYADVSAFETAYQEALEKTTIADTENYNIVLNEDFSNLDESWKQTNIDSGLIGNGKFKTNRESLDVKGTGENYSAHFCGTSLVNHINYIERAIDDPNSVITFYAKISNNTNVSIQAAFDDTQGVGTHAEANARRIKNINGSGTSERVDTSKYIGLSTTNWNKIVIDGTTGGKVSCYVNGALLSTVDGKISNLKIGSIFDYAGYSVVAVDNVTIAVEKAAEEALPTFNDGTVTEETLTKMLKYTTYGTELYNSLPECDRVAIAAELENGRPYADIPAFETAYQKALINATQTNPEMYNIEWQEDFSGGLTSDWTVTGSLIANAVGVGNVSGLTRASLNISGNETASVGFVGASVANTGVNYIERAILHPNSIVTVYFYDCENDKTPCIDVSVNDHCSIGVYGANKYYCYNVDGTWKNTSIERKAGWHKVVFDSLSMPGVVSGYLDGVEVMQKETDIVRVSVGNASASASYNVEFVDNITVAVNKSTETFRFMNRRVEVTDTLPSADRITLTIEEPEYATDYIAVTYADRAIIGITMLTKEEQRGGVLAKNITITGADELKLFRWDSLNGMKSKGEVTHLER